MEIDILEEMKIIILVIVNSDVDLTGEIKKLKF